MQKREKVTYEFVDAYDAETCVRNALDWLSRGMRQDGVTTSVVSSDEIGECDLSIDDR